ncbi:MAG: exodeoxyribonuclease VII large subunit [Bacteroidales bacterium]|nr:exodeoxyribonuclease VII large subunit [Bacteroidales bacterium]
MEEREYIDLLELQTRIKEGIQDAFPGRYWVKAEISSWSPRANGHCYLTLTQSRAGKPVAESRAMIWKWHYTQIVRYFEEATGQKLQAGITVLVKVQVSFSELYGISLYIEDIDAAFTLGEQALERKRAIERLTKDGYMDMQKELAIPDIPQRLAVITSKTAAGYQDFRNHLLNNPDGYAFTLHLYEATMQGEQAPSSIADALSEAQEKDYDAILILRGGGSETDLLCFDDFNLAIAIATCPVPVVTAIGHDKDVHIADMVAHESVKTPTALADLFLDALAAAEDAARDLVRRIAQAAMRLAGAQELRLESLDSAIHRAIRGRVAALEVQLQRSIGRITKGLTQKYSDVARLRDTAVHRIQFAAQARIGSEVSRVALKEAVITGSDPRKILGLGYVLVTGKDNKILKTVDRVAVGDRIGVRFNDGSLTAKVDEIYSDKIDNTKTNIA